jgi:uncharacterized protein
VGWEALVAGLPAGLAFGAWSARHTVCLNAGLRRAADGRDWTILRLFAAAIVVQLLLLPLLVALDVPPFDEGFPGGGALPGIGLFPLAQVLGGLLFGFGMALAGGCIAGILWKSGAGSVATAIAIAGFAAGELLARGALAPLGRDLDQAIAAPTVTEESGGAINLELEEPLRTLPQLLGIDFIPLALILGGIGALVLIGARGVGLARPGVRAGIVLGLIGVGTWVLAGVADYGYGLGFVGAADSARDGLGGGTVTFAVWLAFGTLAGAALAVRGPLRVPDGRRAIRAAGGGVAMGVGANFAHGCNIGHGLTGLPLLSLGSLLAIGAIAAGALLTWRLLLRDRPALRGRERPEPNW